MSRETIWDEIEELLSFPMGELSFSVKKDQIHLYNEFLEKIGHFGLTSEVKDDPENEAVVHAVISGRLTLLQLLKDSMDREMASRANVLPE